MRCDEGNMENRYLISESLIKAIHEYLLSQPMRQVESLVVALRTAEMANQKADNDNALNIGG